MFDQTKAAIQFGFEDIEAAIAQGRIFMGRAAEGNLPPAALELMEVYRGDIVDIALKIKYHTKPLRKMLEEASSPLLPIEELGLTVRALNGLKSENILLVSDLVLRDEVSLALIPNIGWVTLQEIKAALSARGLSLKDYSASVDGGFNEKYRRDRWKAS